MVRRITAFVVVASSCAPSNSPTLLHNTPVDGSAYASQTKSSEAEPELRTVAELRPGELEGKLVKLLVYPVSARSGTLVISDSRGVPPAAPLQLSWWRPNEIAFEPEYRDRVLSFVAKGDRAELRVRVKGDRLTLAGIDAVMAARDALRLRDKLEAGMSPGDQFDVELKREGGEWKHCYGAPHPLSLLEGDDLGRAFPVAASEMHATPTSGTCFRFGLTFEGTKNQDLFSVRTVALGDRVERRPADVLYSPRQVAEAKNREGFVAIASACNVRYRRPTMRVAWGTYGDDVEVQLSKEQLAFAEANLGKCVTLRFHPRAVTIIPEHQSGDNRYQAFRRLFSGVALSLEWFANAHPSRFEEWQAKVGLQWPHSRGDTFTTDHAPRMGTEHDPEPPQFGIVGVAPAQRRMLEALRARGQRARYVLRAAGLSSTLNLTTTLVNLIEVESSAEDAEFVRDDDAIERWKASDDSAIGQRTTITSSVYRWWADVVELRTAPGRPIRVELEPLARRNLEIPDTAWSNEPLRFVVRHGGFLDGRLRLVAENLVFARSPSSGNDLRTLIEAMRKGKGHVFSAAARPFMSPRESLLSVFGTPVQLALNATTENDFKFLFGAAQAAARFRIIGKSEGLPLVQVVDVDDKPPRPRKLSFHTDRWVQADDGLWARDFSSLWPLHAKLPKSWSAQRAPLSGSFRADKLARLSSGLLYFDGELTSD